MDCLAVRTMASKRLRTRQIAAVVLATRRVLHSSAGQASAGDGCAGRNLTCALPSRGIACAATAAAARRSHPHRTRPVRSSSAPSIGRMSVHADADCRAQHPRTTCRVRARNSRKSQPPSSPSESPPTPAPSPTSASACVSALGDGPAGCARSPAAGARASGDIGPLVCNGEAHRGSLGRAVATVKKACARL